MKPAVQLALAKALMDASEYAKAESVWTDIAKDNAVMAPVAELGKAKCKMLAGDFAGAIKVLQNLKNSAGPAYASSIDRMLAEAAEKSGNIQMAVQSYQALMTSNPNERMYLESKIKELKAKL